MKAPDKIYIQIDDTINFVSEVFSRKPVDGNYFRDEEYIRKEALVERLEKVAAEYKKRSDEGELVWQNMCGINEAIDILNKM